MSPIFPAARGMRRQLPRASVLRVVIGACLLACASVPEPAAVDPASGKPDFEILYRGESERALQLERDVERLRADLRHAEEALVAVESGLLGSHTRADAVSALAEARILVKRGQVAAPWRQDLAEEAWGKLSESEGQLGRGHFGTAMFFSARAKRLAGALLREARSVEESDGHRFVAGSRVNLRAGPSTSTEVIGVLVRDTPVIPEREANEWVLVRTPSGRIGWIHGSLLRAG